MTLERRQIINMAFSLPTFTVENIQDGTDIAIDVINKELARLEAGGYVHCRDDEYRLTSDRKKRLVLVNELERFHRSPEERAIQLAKEWYSQSFGLLENPELASENACAAITEAVEAEREACASLAETFGDVHLAAAIRARSDREETVK